MKLSEHWLRQWVNPNLSAAQIGEQLTMAGLELDGLDKVAKDFSGVVVAEVLSVAPHPDADRLKVVQVTTGGEPVQIVCGASNVAVGVKVPLATVGAVLPADKDGKSPTIKKGKLRGVVSMGMLCGGLELDLDDGVDGLLILPDDAPIGADLRDYLGLDDYIFDIAITPNRGDCLSVCGVARELAALNELPFAWPFALQAPKEVSQTKKSLNVSTPFCPYYAVQVLEGLSNTASPRWIKEALTASGIKPKNVLVDVTNFVMMELGQPLHVFDNDKVVGDIGVRLAKKGETLVLLNEQTITLLGDELVIADEVSVIALAGIMGGKRTAVDENTTSVILESAFFEPLAIAGRARRFGLHTDASQRFERGVDFELAPLAQQRAINLLCQFAGGQAGVVNEHKAQQQLPKRPPIHLPYAKIQRLLGVAIDKATVLGILNRLQINASDHGEYLIAHPPSHRFDLTIAEDLVEEVARIYGYERIDSCLPSFRVSACHQPSDDEGLLFVKHTLVSSGYVEAISFGFCDEALERLLATGTKPLALTNPISSELAVMRTTLLSGLLPCVQYNLKRQQSGVRLFEVGLSFVGDSVQTVNQQEKLALVATGSVAGERLGSVRPMDFYDLKGDIEKLLPWHADISYERSDRPLLHPGQGASIVAFGREIGFFGQLHPTIAKALDLPTTWVAELDAGELFGLYGGRPITAPSRFPQVRRDLAFIVDKDTPWQAIWHTVKQHAGTKLVDGWLFDVYEGESLPAGKKSLAFAMVWQDTQATLDDEEIRRLFEAVIWAIKEQFGAILRDGGDGEIL